MRFSIDFQYLGILILLVGRDDGGGGGLGV